jgi:acylphosphatase
MTSQHAIHVTIRGRVQGVGYRAWVEYQASASELEGWVRNRRDGSVEALFAGPAGDVRQMLARCHEGPRSAHVTAVTILEEGSESPMAFEVLPTA